MLFLSTLDRGSILTSFIGKHKMDMYHSIYFTYDFDTKRNDETFSNGKTKDGLLKHEEVKLWVLYPRSSSSCLP
ncbi:hypothetical protein SAMN04490247_0434 [Salimicrobium halophilum]|uniref:Uncharacterized protein n=1 Tax=Salimicrobium halophilum TaxID=86666 RepID=A0A1G8Q6Y7_9BACI|nr:hypothetical protein SAMN04490247_0434 [Salimicrobium halophilum]